MTIDTPGVVRSGWLDVRTTDQLESMALRPSDHTTMFPAIYFGAIVAVGANPDKIDALHWGQLVESVE